MRVLADTNILLDFFYDREPHNIYADKIFELCGKGEL